MLRVAVLATYGALCYAASMLSLVVLFLWMGGPAWFPIRLDDGGGQAPSVAAYAWNAAIMIAFALSHSLLARTAIKRRTRPLVGRNLERVTYNLLAALLAILLCLAWKPIPLRMWEISWPAGALLVQVVYVLLWVIHMASIVLMNHNEFFGLRQIRLAMRRAEYRPLPVVSEAYYLWTRVTLVVSLALIPWASPIMTAGRFELCLFMTGYVAFGAWLSNRDRGDLATTSASVTAEAPALRAPVSR
jgi:methanethiol S-methyltransferase